MRKKDQNAQSVETLIYCGPSLPKLGLIHSTSYIGGLPRNMEEHFEKCSSLKQLFVPVERVADTLIAINIQGTAQHTWNESIKSYANGGGK
ncbi:hypothetical protein J31TS6_56960 [Brevibacillus reuszeri]|uniref:hypothetical protein n=1 Tax=Brevibacillus reuszeri TaxID=54915 RepID=UPI001AFFD329|nr:hypothetical protein [Brevibacillus reuszeri]GIO09668.1 hypothetical protein J31TS6_56960 [Brevibacillus reuszeri]